MAGTRRICKSPPRVAVTGRLWAVRALPPKVASSMTFWRCPRRPLAVAWRSPRTAGDDRQSSKSAERLIPAPGHEDVEREPSPIRHEEGNGTG